VFVTTDHLLVAAIVLIAAILIALTVVAIVGGAG
jgi:hypothetical protein